MRRDDVTNFEWVKRSRRQYQFWLIMLCVNVPVFIWSSLVLGFLNAVSAFMIVICLAHMSFWAYYEEKKLKEIENGKK